MGNETEYQYLTPLGKFVKFLSWFTFIPMIILYFLGYSVIVDILFIVWLISGILVWIIKIK